MLLTFCKLDSFFQYLQLLNVLTDRHMSITCSETYQHALKKNSASLAWAFLQYRVTCLLEIYQKTNFSCWFLQCPAHLIEPLLKNVIPLAFERIQLNVANVKYKFYHVYTVYLLLHNTSFQMQQNFQVFSGMLSMVLVLVLFTWRK